MCRTCEDKEMSSWWWCFITGPEGEELGSHLILSPRNTCTARVYPSWKQKKKSEIPSTQRVWPEVAGCEDERAYTRTRQWSRRWQQSYLTGSERHTVLSPMASWNRRQPAPWTNLEPALPTEPWESPAELTPWLNLSRELGWAISSSEPRSMSWFLRVPF